jgi:hypothetical protein
MMLTFVYTADAAALLGLPAEYTWCRAGSWPHPPGLSLRPPSSALSPWPRALARCTAPRPSPLIFGLIADGVGAGAVASRRWGWILRQPRAVLRVAESTSQRKRVPRLVRHCAEAQAGRTSGWPLGHCSDAGQVKSADAESARHFPLIRSRSTRPRGTGFRPGVMRPGPRITCRCHRCGVRMHQRRRKPWTRATRWRCELAWTSR